MPVQNSLKDIDVRPREIKRKQNVAVDRNLTRDNWRVLEFRERLKHVALRDDLDVGSLCTALTTDVADAARTCFMKGKDEPRKDWISGDSWQLIKWAQIIRADLRVSRASVSGMRAAVAFNAKKWIAAGDGTADEWVGAVRTSWLMVCAQAAIAQRQLEVAQARKRHSLKGRALLATLSEQLTVVTCVSCTSLRGGLELSSPRDGQSTSRRYWVASKLRK